MASATEKVDDFVKDYLLFRGCTSTLKSFENELKIDKDKALRPDKILEQLQMCISAYELSMLRDYWAFLNGRLFSRLEQRYMPSVRKLEIGLLKYYVVNATQNNRQDRVLDFFDKMTPELQHQSEFKDWFAYPFIRNPEENSNYMMYFSKGWQDTFFLSLFNFLSVIIQAMHILFSPSLLNFDIDHKRMKNLQEENELLKQQLIAVNRKPESASRSVTLDSEPIQRGANSMELVYDFSEIADEEVAVQKQQKSGRKFPFSGSPLLGKKNTNQSGQSKSESAFKNKPPGKQMTSNRSVPKGSPVSLQQRQTKSSTGMKGPSSLQTSATDNDKKTEISQSYPSKIMSANETASQSAGKDSTLSQRHKSTDDYLKERKQLLENSASKRYSESDVSSPRSTPPLHRAQTVPGDKVVPKGAKVELTQFPIPETTHGDTEKEAGCPFIMLSQEEYNEHRSAISYCRFSNTGQYVASVDIDGVVKVWSWSPQPATAATVMSKSAFLSLEWASKADRWLLLGNRSGNIRLFDVKEMKSFYEATADTSFPRIVSLCSTTVGGSFVCSATVNRARSGSSSGPTSPGLGRVGKLTVWDLRTMTQTKQLPVEPGPVAINCLSYNHNGQLLLTGAADGQIRIYDMQQHKCISQWEAHHGEIHSVQFSADETTCHSLGADEKFHQWSIHTPGQMLELPIHQGASLPFLNGSLVSNKEVPRGKLFSFDAEGQYILTCDKNKGILYRKADQPLGLANVMEIQGHKSNITTVDWSPGIDTRVCLTGAMDGKIKLTTLLPS
ncbi:hypothetical protein FSP39_005505 [Pinctada imbricata]|uniref:WD repeat-containing protein 91 n=1 Tax=Pinctada imbricata TaxID=66713 RepID=A0AA88XZ68_PINIB|nr:hypothetical protein FSP39_005505 [Pinctada imbricata]